MTRAATGDTIVVRPTNDIYTVLVIIATLVVVLGLVIVIVRTNTLFPEHGLGLF